MPYYTEYIPDFDESFGPLVLIAEDDKLVGVYMGSQNQILDVFEPKMTRSSNHPVLKQTIEWLDFVCACRRGENIYQQYDVIIGNVANDDIFKSVDMYFRGVWDKQKTIEELRYYKKNDQFAFVKQFMLDKYLKFVNAYADSKALFLI